MQGLDGCRKTCTAFFVMSGFELLLVALSVIGHRLAESMSREPPQVSWGVGRVAVTGSHHVASLFTCVGTLARVFVPCSRIFYMEIFS